LTSSYGATAPKPSAKEGSPQPPVIPSRLYVICDADVCAAAGWTLVDFARACLDGGATLLQIRGKELSGAALLDTVAAVIEQGGDALVIVNDRADIAQLAKAGGVHVGQDDLSPAAVRAIVGDGAVIGLSTHTDAQLAEAFGQPLGPRGYVAIGPIFRTATKHTGFDPLGLDRVAAAATEAKTHGLPLVAIGGITLAHAAAVIDAGADAIAVISDLLSTGDPSARVREFLRALR
jgi:thiamine-phosphate pyrophosphorylase